MKSRVLLAVVVGALVAGSCSRTVSDATSTPPSGDVPVGSTEPSTSASQSTTDLPRVALQPIATDPDRLVEVLVGAGFCTGACWTQISFDGADFRYESENHDGQLVREAVGELTAEGTNRVSAAIALLADVDIQARYGDTGSEGTGLILRFRIDGREVQTNYASWDLPRTVEG
ncbi:MAG: hypothetical protein HKN91_13330, partial [Acidimicrobiia bacterium]|nr:hypothetical protein [Acidimicrobiia bacterium]